MNSYLKMTLRMLGHSLLNRFSRVVIASLSIAVGAAILSALGLIAYTVPAQLSQELRTYGANMVVIPTGTELIDDNTVSDTTAEVGDLVLGKAPVRYDTVLYNQQAIDVMATDLSEIPKLRPYWDIDGSMPQSSTEILIGSDTAKRFGLEKGQSIEISDHKNKQGPSTRLTISGLLRTGDTEDSFLIMSFDTLSKISGDTGSYNVIEYSINGNDEQLNSTAAKISESNPKIEGQVVRRLSESQSGIAHTLQTLVWMVGVVILLLTLISVSATLNSIVAERSSEIALKKSLGALRKDIIREFLTEAVLLGLLGGVAGVAIGIYTASYVSRQAFAVNMHINWLVLPITLVASVLVAMLGSYVPAARISKVKPSDVLGGE